MRTLAIYAGSFDPVHAGHIATIETAKRVFGDDSVLVLVADNPGKSCTVSKDVRADWVRRATGVRVQPVTGYICDFCDKWMRTSNLVDGQPVYDGIVLVRGVRNGSDLESEMPMAGYNYSISHGKYPTVLLPCPVGLRDMSSTAVRTLARKDWDTFFSTLYRGYAPATMSYAEWQVLAMEIHNAYSKGGN